MINLGAMRSGAGAEEQVRLVSAPAGGMEQTREQRGEPNLDAADRGELMQWHGEHLSHFHREAAAQAGCGRFQLLSSVPLALALLSSGAGSSYSSLAFALPSIGAELCLSEARQRWLCSAALLGAALGGAFWGVLADRAGRKRALLSALSVHVVFGAIAAFVPAYGPLVMANFVSAAGAAGAPVLAASLLLETAHGRKRSQLCALLGSLFAGGCAAALAASALLPHSGRDMILENKRHFSAYHRYLLACSAPTLAALVCALWTCESPLFLLQCGREVEALAAYQEMYERNGRSGRLCPMEMELPDKRPRRAPRFLPLDALRLLCQPLLEASWRLAAAYSGVLLATAAVYLFACSAVVAHKRAQYAADTRSVRDRTFHSAAFDRALENVVYENALFVNCTFRDCTFSHVVFRNCSFVDVEFANIMSSYAFFENSAFLSTRFVDTDLNTARHMDADCRLVNSTILGLAPVCPLETDHNIYLEETILVRASLSGAALLAASASALLLIFLPVRFVAVGALSATTLMSPGMYVVSGETAVVVYSSLFSAALGVAFVALTVIVVESYPVDLRCSAHGFLYSLGNVCALVSSAVYSDLELHLLGTLLLLIVGIVSVVVTLKIPHTSSDLI